MLAALLLIFTSCRKGETNKPPVSYGYNSATTAPQSDGIQGEAASTVPGTVAVDTSWQDNYRLTFNYFVAGTTESTVSVSEKKTVNIYTTTDTSDGLTLYYVQNGTNVDYYQIYKDNPKQQHAVYSNKSVESIKSRFMEMSEVDEGITSKPNSAYAGESVVAGRNTQLYIQRGYKDGVLTATAYYYIDEQYGFCSKAQVFDAEDNVTMFWELTSFSAGSVSNDDISIDLSQYTFEDVTG